MADPSTIYFYAPPGWPSGPPGILPPAGWQPDPALPQPPKGWVYYRNAAGHPVDAPDAAWRPPAATSTGFGAEPAAVHPGGVHETVSPKRRRRLSHTRLFVSLTGVLVVLVLTGALIHVLGPKPFHMSTEQFAELAQRPKIGEWTTRDWPPYTDAPPDFSLWPDPPPYSGCTDQRAFVKEHMLRHAGGKILKSTAEESYLSGSLSSITLWSDAEALNESAQLGKRCHAENPNAEKAPEPIDRGKHTTSWVRWATDGVENSDSVTLTIGNVQASWVCIECRLTEDEKNRVEEMLVKDITRQ